MPRITGTAAKKFYLKYLEDAIVGGTNVEAHVLMTRRHIHWLRTIDITLENAPDDTTEYVKQRRFGTRGRRLVLTNDAVPPKRRTLVFPDPNHVKWTKPLDDVTIADTFYALEGETGLWKITGRIGEKESIGTRYADDVPGTT